MNQGQRKQNKMNASVTAVVVGAAALPGGNGSSQCWLQWQHVSSSGSMAAVADEAHKEGATRSDSLHAPLATRINAPDRQT
jgi:hypothetical protein